MHNMKMSRKPQSRGMLKSSPHRSLSSEDIDKPFDSLKVATTSRYFNKSSEDSQSSLSLSPYKDCLGEVKSSLNDTADDFRASVKIAKDSKIRDKKGNARGNVLKKRTRQPKISNFLESTVRKLTDCNPDHLQMALALSQSSYEAENPESVKQNDSSRSIEEKRDLFRKTLDQLGFGHKKQKLFEARNKKSRYRFVKPVLYIRTPEEREELVTSKVSLLLVQNSEAPHEVKGDICRAAPLSCTSLQRTLSEPKILNLNNLSLNELNGSVEFYLKSLNFDPSKSPFNLLKSWKDIPGRERSPEKGNGQGSPMSPNHSQSNDEISEQHDTEISFNVCDFEEPAERSNIDEELCGAVNDDDNRSTSVEINEEDPVNLSWRSVSPDLFCSDVDATTAFEKFNSSLQSISEETQLKNADTHFGNRPSDEPVQNEIACEKNQELFFPEDYCNEVHDTSPQKQIFLDATSDLNVTDYVHKLLNRESTGSSSTFTSVLYSIAGVAPINGEVDEPFATTNTSEDDSIENFSNSGTAINDEELNYSSTFTNPVMDNLKQNETDEDGDGKNEKIAARILQNVTEIEPETILHSTPDKHASKLTQNVTPNNRFVVKTKDITPMADYKNMDTPEIVKELNHFGLKPLKRQRGVKLLQYIYDSTHPLVRDRSDSEKDDQITKKRRISCETCLPETDNMEVSRMLCDLEGCDLIFEKTQSKRIHSCRIPLDIVWHNFLSCNPQIRERVLLYEPLKLESLHSMLKEQGFKFNVHDLLTFLDRKCITVKTVQGNGKAPKK